jgi:hypothetical protein
LLLRNKIKTRLCNKNISSAFFCSSINDLRSLFCPFLWLILCCWAFAFNYFAYSLSLPRVRQINFRRCKFARRHWSRMPLISIHLMRCEQWNQKWLKWQVRKSLKMCKRIKTEFNGYLEPNGESDKFVIGEGEGEKKAKQINFTFLFVTLIRWKWEVKSWIALKMNCYLSAILWWFVQRKFKIYANWYFNNYGSLLLVLLNAFLETAYE